MKCVHVEKRTDEQLTVCGELAAWILPLGRTALCNVHKEEAEHKIQDDPQLLLLVNSSDKYQFQRL